MDSYVPLFPAVQNTACGESDTLLCFFHSVISPQSIFESAQTVLTYLTYFWEHLFQSDPCEHCPLSGFLHKKTDFGWFFSIPNEFHCLASSGVPTLLYTICLWRLFTWNLQSEQSFQFVLLSHNALSSFQKLHQIPSPTVESPNQEGFSTSDFMFSTHHSPF